MKRTCPGCQAELKKGAVDCKVCGYQLVDTARIAATVIRPAAAPKYQIDCQIAVCIDGTASSQRFSTGIPRAFEISLDPLEQKARSVTPFVQVHGDLDEKQMPVLITDGGTVKQALEDIRRIQYEGGGDPPEHHLDAIEHLFETVPWTLDPTRSRGAIIAFLTADSKPATTGHSATEIGRKIKEAGILLYLICEPTPTLRELASAADGMLFQISNDPDPLELAKISGQLAASIVATVGSGSTVPVRPAVQ